MNKKIPYVVLVILVLLSTLIFWLRMDNKNDGLDKSYVQALKNDNTGGKTPQETLNIFLEKLVSGDTAGASSLFWLKEDLSREAWSKALDELKKQELLDDMAKDIKEKSMPDPNNSGDETFRFFLNDNGITVGIITLKFNKYSGVWKIESI
mgnify:CR=1 FL=1